MEHRKLDALMSPMERIARVAAAGVSASRAQQTSPSGAISLDNADGTRTIIGEVSNGEANPSYTMATHVGDATPPGIPTGITATSRSGVVVVEWDGTLSGGIPDDFFCVRVYLDNVELGALSEAGSVASAKLQSGTTHSITATSEDDCCLPDGTPAHNVSDATQAISVTVAKDASEVMADIDEQIEGVEQEIADFKSNTYTKAQTDKKVQDLDDEISTELTTNYYNKTQIDTTYATKTLVSQTKDEIELSASQTYANKGAGNPNLGPFFAHDLADVYDATINPDGYWKLVGTNPNGSALPGCSTQLIGDGWAHAVKAASSANMVYAVMPDDGIEVGMTYTVLFEFANAQLNDDFRFQVANASAYGQLGPSESYIVPINGVEYLRLTYTAVQANELIRFNFQAASVGELDIRVSYYANTEATIDGQQVTLPYEGSFKPYVTDQESLAKTYATNSALTVGLDGVRSEVSQTYATKGAGNPNVTPLTAHDTKDRYNATTNPDGYWWANISGYENIEDGWVHVERAAATGTQWAQQFQTVLLENLKPSTKYTLLMEYRNVSVTGTLTAWPLYASSDQFAYPPETTAFTVDRDMVVRAQLMTKDSFEGIATGVDARHRLVPPSGGSGSCSYDLRLSLYENASGAEGENLPYDGAYKPYVTDQESLSKTYTKSSTFTQTVNGLDGRITATEDGLAVQETLIRQYAGGVLVCKVGENIGALVNATGSFDVVGVSWNGDEPTVTGTFSTFMQSLIELGKGNTNAEIQFCDNTGNISVQQNYKGNQAITMDADNTTIHGDEDVYVAAGAEWGQYALVSELSKMVELHAATSSTQMGNIRVSPTSVGIDYTTSQAAGASISMLDVTPEGGSAYPVLDLYVSGGPIEMNASGGVKVLGPTGEGTAMRGLFFGSKIINPNGAAYGTLFTQAECVSSFGRALSQTKDVVLVMNGDTGVYSGQMTASLNSSSEVRVYMSPTRSGLTRINYLVVLGA